MQGQLEDDIDTEIENMKRLNEEKLAISRETTLKYKGTFAEWLKTQLGT